MRAVISRVTRPLTKLSIVVQRLADGDTAVEIPAMRRNDELGSMAAALSIFNAHIIDALQLRKEQAEREQRQLQQRKAEMAKLADDFEGAVGEIIEAVSASSNELEASAGTLTATAVRSQELARQIAAAFEEASTNARSAASAAEAMTSPVNESAARCWIRRGSASARLLDCFRLRSSSFGGRDRRNG
jgi:methyl-accepting chemotaxis protein